MSVYSRVQKKKGKHPRWSHKSYHTARRNKQKRRILKNSGWKLQFPELFKLIQEFPYIVRK